MKKMFLMCLILVTLISVASCGGTTESTETTAAQSTQNTTAAPPETTAETTSEDTTEATIETTTEAVTPSPQQPIEVAQGSEAKLYVVMPETDCNNTAYAKDKLFYYVKNTTGAELPFGTKTDGVFELLLGDTGREESAALKSTLSGDRYAVKVEDNKVVIVATNPAFLYDGVTYLIENLLVVEGERIALNTTAADYVGRGDTSSLRYLLTQSKTLYAGISRSDGWPDEIIKQPSDTQHTQGGCTDGEYIYQAFIYKDTSSNEQNNVCKIVKFKPDFDPNTTTPLKISDPLALNHANDITYNSKTNELFVCHNNPNRTKVSVIDPDTLELKRTITISQKIYSLSYNPERDVFVVGISGGQNMLLFDGKMKNIVSRTMRANPDTTKMTTQGICSDDTFIYHTLWNSAGTTAASDKNVIAVYDWYGTYVGLIYTKVSIETENIFIHDGILYVAAYSSGGKGSYIYRIEPKLK